MKSFLSGVLMTQYVLAAAYFFRFWQVTRDRLFAYFGVAFTLMGVERVVLEVFNPPTEKVPYIYLLRLMAFGLILLGIVQKNRAKRPLYITTQSVKPGLRIAPTENRAEKADISQRHR